jgi:hypothetical protein
MLNSMPLEYSALDAQDMVEPSRVVLPTLVIGLGGTGFQALDRLKGRWKSAWDTQESDFRQLLQLLVIDTVSIEKQFNREHLEHADYFYTAANGPTPAEQIVKNLNRHPAIQSWWDWDESVLPHAFIDDGAGQVPCVGRLVFYHRYTQIKREIEKRMEPLVTIANRMPRGNVETPGAAGVNIFVVASLCGGTGAGMLLDIGLMLKEMYYDRARIYGILAMPSVFSPHLSPAEIWRLKANAYAALKELDYLQSGKKLDIQYPHEAAPTARTRPFKQVFMVELGNAQGLTLRSQQSTAELISHFLYLTSMSALGKAYLQRELNVARAPYHLKIGDWVRQASSDYAAFGVGGVFVPLDSIKAVLRSALAEATARLMLEAPPANNRQETLALQGEEFGRALHERSKSVFQKLVAALELRTLDAWRRDGPPLELVREPLVETLEDFRKRLIEVVRLYYLETTQVFLQEVGRELQAMRDEYQAKLGEAAADEQRVRQEQQTQTRLLENTPFLEKFFTPARERLDDRERLERHTQEADQALDTAQRNWAYWRLRLELVRQVEAALKLLPDDVEAAIDFWKEQRARYRHQRQRTVADLDMRGNYELEQSLMESGHINRLVGELVQRQSEQPEALAQLIGRALQQGEAAAPEDTAPEGLAQLIGITLHPHVTGLTVAERGQPIRLRLFPPGEQRQRDEQLARAIRELSDRLANDLLKTELDLSRLVLKHADRLEQIFRFTSIHLKIASAEIDFDETQLQHHQMVGCFHTDLRDDPKLARIKGTREQVASQYEWIKTDAKERLDVFVIAMGLPIDLVSGLSQDLYAAYRDWARAPTHHCQKWKALLPPLTYEEAQDVAKATADADRKQAEDKRQQNEAQQTPDEGSPAA